MNSKEQHAAYHPGPEPDDVDPLHMKKQPPKPPRGPNNYTQEIERRARQAQHKNNKTPKK